MSGIHIGALSSEVARMMQEYASDVAEDMKKEAKSVAREAVKDLKTSSPEGKGSKKGHYKDGWESLTERENATSISIRVHNKKKPGLTHLLEKGHAKRNGGKTKAYPHIEPAEKKAAEEYEKRLIARLSK